MTLAEAAEDCRLEQGDAENQIRKSDGCQTPAVAARTTPEEHGRERSFCHKIDDDEEEERRDDGGRVVDRRKRAGDDRYEYPKEERGEARGKKYRDRYSQPDGRFVVQSVPPRG